MTETITPNLDKFAEGALVFHRAYCQQAVCVPTGRCSVCHAKISLHVRLAHPQFLFFGAKVFSVPKQLHEVRIVVQRVQHYSLRFVCL